MAKKVQKGGGSALDLAMAAFAGTAAGFVMFAMPDWQFDRAVELSGLPLILPAAQPPLGMTARLAAIAAAAIGTWILVWLVLRALSQKPPEPKSRPKPVEIDVPLPRLRRADAHPDAPARRPILAALELGAPLNAEPEAEQEGEETIVEAVKEEEAPEEEIVLDSPLPSFIAEAEATEELEEADPDEDPEIPEIRDSVAPDGPAGEHEGASIAHLMQRLELGLLRRERTTWDGPTGEPRQNEAPSPQLDQRLRSAIDDLQRLAARGG
ncbi:MAG TPA: hypothetical protein VGB57_06545 [Allosphingosinicella sp.]|jgi:hypothetical protein